MTEDEFEERIGELELKYEELEQRFYILFTFLVGIGVHLQWHNWFITIFVAVLTYVIGWKFGAEKPFTKGIPK